MKPLSIILIIYIIFALMLHKSHIDTFFDAPSLLVVVVLPVIASIPARHGFVGFKLLFKDGGNETKERKKFFTPWG